MKNLAKKIGMMTFLFCVVLFLFLTGCKPAIYTVDGSWSGTTSQGQNVSFTVVSNGITYFKIKILTGGGGSVESQTWPSSCPITDNSFTLSLSGSVAINITGEFTSNTKADGSFSLGSISGTWTASR